MNLRNATAEDAPALAMLGAEAFSAAFAHLYRPQDLQAFLEASHSLAKVSAELADRLYRVQVASDENGTLLGFCKLVMACGWPEHASTERVIELKQLYTNPTITGQGIGAALMDWALAQAADHGAQEVQLSVYCDNHGAQRFYARYGFTKVADIHFLVGEQRDHEFLFAKVL